MTTLSRLETVERWVHGAGEQVAIGVDQVADPDQVVVEVAEVALVLRGHPLQEIHPGEQPGKHVAFGGDHLAEGHQRPLHREQLAELGLGRLLEDGVLQGVDPVVELGQHREVGVDQLVDDQVEDRDRRG